MQCSLNLGFIETDNNSAIYIDNRYAHLSGLPHHFLSAAHICSDIIFGKWNAILAEPIFCHPAVSAAWCGVDCNRHISSCLVVGFCGLWLHMKNNIYKVVRQDIERQKMKQASNCLRLVNVGIKEYCLISAWVVAFTCGSGCLGLGGRISLSASTSSTRTYFQYELSPAFQIQAAIPLAIGSEVLTQSVFAESAFAAKGKIAGAEFAAGKLAINDAAGFLAKADAISNRGSSMLSVSSPGSANDPWGLSVEAKRWALFAAKGPLYSDAAFQYVLADRPRSLAVAAGFLMDAQQEIGTALRHASPWIAISAGYFHHSSSILARIQMLPNFQSARQIQADLDWAKGAAARLDFSFRKGNSSVEGFAYAEAGDFISASGDVAAYDALIYFHYDAVFPGSPIIKSVSLRAGIYSKQGAVSPKTGSLPAWGQYPDPLLLRYWPDKADINFKINNTERRFNIFNSPGVLDSAFSAGISIEPSDWRARLQMDLHTRHAGKTYPQYGINLAIQGSFALPEDEANAASEPENAVENAEENAAAGNFYEYPEQQGRAISYLDKILGRMQISLSFLFEKFSSRLAVAIPMNAEESRTYSCKIQIGLKAGPSRLEGSLTLEYNLEAMIISLPYARVFASFAL